MEVKGGVPSACGRASNRPAFCLKTKPSLASGDNDWIWMRLNPETNDSGLGRWILLKRDGRPIPATRGDYQITGADLEADTLLIQDTNTNEQLQYTWSIAIQDGTFEGQTLTTESISTVSRRHGSLQCDQSSTARASASFWDLLDCDLHRPVSGEHEHRRHLLRSRRMRSVWLCEASKAVSTGRASARWIQQDLQDDAYQHLKTWAQSTELNPKDWFQMVAPLPPLQNHQ